MTFIIVSHVISTKERKEIKNGSDDTIIDNSYISYMDFIHNVKEKKYV